jgi:hypothetical protein
MQHVSRLGTIAVLSLVAKLLLPGCAAVPSKTDIDLASQTTRHELVLNTNPEHYSAHKSREAGEEDLYRRCVDTKLEEGFIFVQYRDDSIWYETGKDEKEGELTSTMSSKHFKDAESIDEASLYHFHPEERVNKKGITSETLSAKDALASVEATQVVKSIDPSIEKKFDAKIVVQSGVYTVKANLEALSDNHIRAEAGDKLDRLAMERIKIAIGNSDFDYSAENRANFPDLNRQFAERFSSAGISITFTPRKGYN